MDPANDALEARLCGQLPLPHSLFHVSTYSTLNLYVCNRGRNSPGSPWRIASSVVSDCLLFCCCECAACNETRLVTNGIERCWGGVGLATKFLPYVLEVPQFQILAGRCRGFRQSLHETSYFVSTTTRPFPAKSFPVNHSCTMALCVERASVMVKALSYKAEGRGYETRWGEWILLNLPNPAGRTRPWGLLSL
jgi:hypothetical protein